MCQPALAYLQTVALSSDAVRAGPCLNLRRPAGLYLQVVEHLQVVDDVGDSDRRALRRPISGDALEPGPGVASERDTGALARKGEPLPGRCRTRRP